ncbi:hypothetical protein [Nitrosomonas marina]|uniref:Uncharacterized protein n=1 Tax=Nitrosomonas marina TaxID=917 RepID=A0A1H8AP33_9PROT|nr:hypothetical protein [Nitrosomonas marina]SEM71734.1 hypothetical protein SAMN05216325_101223 [Nitrosomonas marina]
MGNFFRSIIHDGRHGMSSIAQIPERNTQPMQNVELAMVHETKAAPFTTDIATATKIDSQNISAGMTENTGITGDNYIGHFPDEYHEAQSFADAAGLHDLSDKQPVVVYRDRVDSTAESLTNIGTPDDSECQFHGPKESRQQTNQQKANGEFEQLHTEISRLDRAEESGVNKQGNGAEKNTSPYLLKTRMNVPVDFEYTGQRTTQHVTNDKTNTNRSASLNEVKSDEMVTAAYSSDNFSGVKSRAAQRNGNEAQRPRPVHVKKDLGVSELQQNGEVTKLSAARQKTRAETNDLRLARENRTAQNPQVNIGVVNVIVEGPKQSRDTSSVVRHDDQTSRRFLRSL